METLIDNKIITKELTNPMDEEYLTKLQEIVNKNKHNNIELIMNENSEKEESFTKIVLSKSWSKLNKNEKEKILKKYCDEKNYTNDQYNEILTNINKRKIKVKDIDYDRTNQIINNINYKFDE